ncbi:MAG: cation-transporting P-type ATPase, partial [Oscillospiraceae bacterium]|nr:cation-transporting P-type ATPase [Oscillospiraceae bacterium]
MKYYLSPVEEVFGEVKSAPDGITEQEAAARLEQNGKNKLQEAKKISVFARFMAQLKDPMIIILIVAAVISAITGFFEAKQAGTTFVPTD